MTRTFVLFTIGFGAAFMLGCGASVTPAPHGVAAPGAAASAPAGPTGFVNAGRVDRKVDILLGD
jgi:hypothetical protein